MKEKKMTDKFIRIRYTLSRAKQCCATGKIMDVELEKIVPAHSIVRLYTNPYDHDMYNIRFAPDFPGSSGNENMIFNLTKEQYDYVAAQLVEGKVDLPYEQLRTKIMSLVQPLRDYIATPHGAVCDVKRLAYHEGFTNCAKELLKKIEEALHGSY